jgi:hypothetical protein
MSPATSLGRGRHTLPGMLLDMDLTVLALLPSLALRSPSFLERFARFLAHFSARFMTSTHMKTPNQEA